MWFNLGLIKSQTQAGYTLITNQNYNYK